MKYQGGKMKRKKRGILKKKKKVKSMRFRRNELKPRQVKTVDVFTRAEGIHYKFGSYHQKK